MSQPVGSHWLGLVRFDLGPPVQQGSPNLKCLYICLLLLLASVLHKMITNCDALSGGDSYWFSDMLALSKPQVSL